MGSIIEKITEFIKEMLQGWVLDNLETMFTDVNTKVGTIAGEVGQTPSSWNAGIFSMIDNLSDTVMVPIAGMIISAILCYELITMVSSTGSHLHIECLYNGEYYNPLFYFDVGEGTLYGESPGGGGSPGNVIPPDSYDDATVQALMEEAARYLGYPYVWGGSSPSTSFDCSGFVCWVFTNSGVHNLPRTTAQGIYDQCTPVSAADAKAGDIIFFTGTYNSPGPVSHVGIYCGNGVMIHCGDPIKYASINTPYSQSHFYSFGRLN